MCARSVPIITLSIRKDSQLSKGRLPRRRKETEESILVEVDPVSLCALLASVGRQVPLQKILEEFSEMEDSASSSNDRVTFARERLI
jgi:hypothetical protein